MKISHYHYSRFHRFHDVVTCRLFGHKVDMTTDTPPPWRYFCRRCGELLAHGYPQ